MKKVKMKPYDVVSINKKGKYESTKKSSWFFRFLLKIPILKKYGKSTKYPVIGIVNDAGYVDKKGWIDIREEEL